MIASDLLGHNAGQLTVAFLDRTPLELFPREEFARLFLAAAGAPPPRSSGGSFLVNTSCRHRQFLCSFSAAQNCLLLLCMKRRLSIAFYFAAPSCRSMI